MICVQTFCLQNFGVGLCMQSTSSLSKIRASRASDLHSRMTLEEYKSTAPQVDVLHAISRRQPAKPGEIAQEIHLGQPTVTGILRRFGASRVDPAGGGQTGSEECGYYAIRVKGNTHES
jgi:hypothetical protein